MKGLNKPEISRNAPIDELFERIDDYTTLSNKKTGSKGDGDDALTAIYKKISHNKDGGVARIDMMQCLTDYCFSDIRKIEEYSITQKLKNKASGDPEKVNLITISLHDLKIFNKLINLVIIQLIYPLLPANIGIPLVERRLKSFNNSDDKLYKFVRVKNDDLLLKIMNSLIDIFDNSNDNDVCEMMLKGNGFTDLMTILIYFIHKEKKSGDGTNCYLEKFNKVENLNTTFNLFTIYTLLLQSSGEEYKPFISHRLVLLTINRSNGVLNLIDFIVGIRDDEEINIEKLSKVNKILISKPRKISSVEYFTKIFNQVYNILILINRPVMNYVVLNIVETFYNKNKKIVNDFLFKKIWNLLIEEKQVNENGLNNVINILISLSKIDNIELLNHLFKPIMLKLWIYCFYLRKNNLEYHKVLLDLISSFFKITENEELMIILVDNLLNSSGDDWKFETNIENKLTKIVPKTVLDKENASSNFDLINNDLTSSLDLLKELLQKIQNPKLVNKIFIIVLNRWIVINNDSIKLKDYDSIFMLIDLKFLELCFNEFKEDVVGEPKEMLIVIDSLLSQKEGDLKDEEEREADSDDEDDEDDEDENGNILLKLLSAIITENDVNELVKFKPVLSSISNKLVAINTNTTISLSQRINELLSTSSTSSATTENTVTNDDQEILKKSLIELNDPLVPIRAHGLHMLRQLITKKSPIISIEFAVELHLLQLKDSEPFIYLNVIKSLIKLIEFDLVTVNSLIKFYKDKSEDLNNRIKIGEVFLNFIINFNQMFVGDLANKLLEELLEIVRNKDDNETELRISSLSIIGEIFQTNGGAFYNYVDSVLDILIGILQLEKDDTLKRSCIIVLNDLIMFNGIGIVSKQYVKKIQLILDYEEANSNDYFLVEQIAVIKKNINDQIKDIFTVSSTNEQFNKFRI